MAELFTNEIKYFFIANYLTMNTRELTDVINKKFGTNYKQKQLQSYKKNHNLKSGIISRFSKGSIPKNKGTHSCPAGCKKTWFKSGHQPKNTVPVGTEVMASIGYIKVKVGEPNHWKFKHIMEWEKHNGEIPKGSVIIFLDGNVIHTNIENLKMISRSENAIMNRNKLRTNYSELTRTAVLLAKLMRAKSERIRKYKNRR